MTPNARRTAVLVGTIGPLLVFALLASGLRAQDAGRDAIVLPQGATALEGHPQVRIDATRERAIRRELDAAEAARDQLTIRIADGRFYWSSRGDRLLSLSSSGEFTYLSSGEPGRYVRIRRLNDTLTYVEHVDTALGSVTYWGELRVVLGK